MTPTPHMSADMPYGFASNTSGANRKGGKAGMKDETVSWLNILQSKECACEYVICTVLKLSKARSRNLHTKALHFA